MLVARWWPATALATALLVRAPGGTAGSCSPWSRRSSSQPASPPGAMRCSRVGFAVANTIEAVIVLWWLTGFEVNRARPPVLGGLLPLAGRHHPGRLGRRRRHGRHPRAQRRPRPVATDAVGRRDPHGRAGRRAPPVPASVPPPGAASRSSRSWPTWPCSPSARSPVWPPDPSQPVAFLLLPLLHVGRRAVHPPLGELRAAGGRAGHRRAHHSPIAARSSTSPDGSRCSTSRRAPRASWRSAPSPSVAFSVAMMPPARLAAEDPPQRGPARPAPRLRQRYGVHRHRPRRRHHLVQSRRRAAARVRRRRRRRTHHADAVPREPRDPRACAAAAHLPRVRRGDPPGLARGRPGHPRLDLHPQGRQPADRLGERHGRPRRRRPPGAAS